MTRHTRVRAPLFLGLLVVLLVLALAGQARAVPRSYLEVSGGIDVLNTNLDSDVVTKRVIGHFELGLGTQLTDNLLLEASFARLGVQQQAPPILPLLREEELLLPASELAFRVEINPLMMRLRYAPSGLRSGYVKPELSAGLGFYSVTRWLRNAIEPASESDLLPAVDVGVSMLVVLDRNWMGFVGPRYTIMQRRELVDDTRHFDGLSVLLGFRFFLNSPRDEFEPAED